MQNHLLTKQKRKPGYSGFRGMLAAMLFGTFLFSTGAKAAPLSGTYTIDASGSGNYPTFKAAVTDLTTNGISGSVTFNVTAATYSEIVSIGSITGTSSTNTITFHGKGIGNTILTSTGTTVKMAAYTIFDNMTITSTSTSADLINASSSTNCSITNCYVRTPSTTNHAIYANSSFGLTVYNCTVWGSYYGVYLYGTQASATYGNARISHNGFYNQYYYGIYDFYDFKDSIAYNTVDSGGVTTMEDGFDLYYLNGMVVWGNKVYVSAYEAIYMYYIDGYPVSGNPTQSYFVNNWVVSPSGASNNYEPVYLYSYQSNNLTFAFNTYLGLGTADYAFVEFSSCTNVTFANNIFDNQGAGIYNLEIELYNSTSVKLYDGNDIYGNKGSSGFVYFYNGTSGTAYASYSAYASAANAAGYDIHGTSVAPPFVSTTYPYDLHMSATKAAANKGVSGSGISVDMDGKGRFPTPTAGANESYYGITNNNTGVTALISPYAACPGSATVSVTVADLGLNAVTSGGTIAWSWNGVPQTSVNYTTSIPLYGQMNLTLGTVTLTAGVSYTLKAWPTSTNTVANAGGSNDTLTVTGIMAALGSGSYTIDGTKSTGGTNFKTFSDAVTALNAGVCGPVVFNVTAATYNEALTIGNVPGASSSNTITFHGLGRAKTTLTNSGIPVTLNRAAYVTFDNMTISTTGTGNDINDASSTQCGFANDNLMATTSGTGYVINSGSSTGLEVSDCRIIGGYYSLHLTSNFDSFTNNRIINSGYYTIYESGCHGNVFSHNVVDSIYSTAPYAGVYDAMGSGETWDANYFNFRNPAGSAVKFSEYGLYFYDQNQSITTVGSSTVPLTWSFTNNIEYAASSYYGFYADNYNNKAPIVVAFNTIEITNALGNPYYPIYMYWETNNSPTVFVNNIFVSQDAAQYGLYDYVSGSDFVSGVPNWNNGGNMYDGNDWVVSAPSASTFAYAGTSTVTSLAAFFTWEQTNKWDLHGETNLVPNFLNSGPNPLYLDTTRPGPMGVSFSGPYSSSSMYYPGVNYDITGRKRCALFPTAGAFEDPFGKSAKATKIFVPSSGIYPGSPATIYQSHVTGDPAVYVWYIENSNYSTWTPISTSVDLYYSGWTTGTNQLKLVTTSCTGTDSDMVSFTVTAPSAVPVTDFIAASNAIQQNTSDQLTDLSSNGPTRWFWTISPDSITVGTVKQATTNLISGNQNATQNPNVTFYYPGFYQVCLTAYNGLGKGATDCKTNYIQVIPAINLSNTPQTVTTSTGYIFDNGGPQGNYTAIPAPYIQSVLIAPCADSIYLTFSQFDTKCGNDFVKLYNGSSPAASAQINNACSGAGTSGGGPGFNGGPTNLGCTSYCVPNVNAPDTFKSGPKMLLTMFCYSGNAPGFSAYYWVKPSSDKKVAPTFTTASGSDSVCEGQLVTFKNTTAINPKDVPSFEWDLNGDISDGFECVGTCATAQWPYFLPGTVPVTLIAINCGGQDTLVKNITVVSPPKPVAAFSANIVSPTLTDVVTFTSGTVQCVDAYTWSVTPSAGNPGSAASFVNGTSASSPSPMVTFPDTGYYDVALTVSNASGAQTNTKTILKYIHVREPYCQPSVAQLSGGIGITHVVFNTINNYTTPQAAQGYYNFTSNPGLSTNIAIGATYYLSVSRDPNSIFSPINRDAWIDWNEDGYFTGTGENVLKDSNSTSGTYTAKIVIPTTAKIGASILRIATNLYLYPNAPCGPNQFGEYQDYRVYVTPYNIPPVITLKGKDTITIEQGYTYTEPGDSASSYLYGDITTSIKVSSKQVIGSTPGVSFSNLVPGTYLFSYDVTDLAGNKAVTRHRVVVVTPDKTAPNLILAKNSVSGTDTIFQEVSTAINPPNLNPSLQSYVVSSIDLVDGDLTGNVSVDSSLVQLNVVGIYPVTYTSTDLSKNTATKTIYVDVVDTIKPVLSLNGVSPDTIEVNAPFVDPGVSVSVSNTYLSKSELIRYIRVNSSVNDSALGVYKIVYSLTDTFGNVAKSVTRIVVVADKLPPVITLLGPVHDSVPVNNTYYDRGYTVSDNFTKTANIKVSLSGTFITTFGKSNFASKLGGGRDSVNSSWSTGPAYRLTITAVDGSGNKASVTRYIEVYDNTAPTITLVGPNPVNVCRWFPYTDAGYTLSDNFNDSIDMQSHNKGVQKGGTFWTDGTSMAQLVSLYYTVKDQAGNIGMSQIRYINVKESGSAGCVSGIEPGLGLDKYITVFPNPSSGIFNVEANLPASQNVRISVMNMLGQEMMVVHDGSLLNNSFRVDLSSQPAGVYFLNIVSDNQTLTKRIEIAK